MGLTGKKVIGKPELLQKITLDALETRTNSGKPRQML